MTLHRGDLAGGVTAAIVALPLALAFGVSSGAGAIAGVYSAILVGFFAAIFGGTPTQISGPTGPMTIVMAAVLTKYIAIDAHAGPAIAFTVVLMAGLLQILFGLLRLGKYIVLVPYPVISGFMSGVGLIIILLQIGPFLGHEAISGVLPSVQAIPHHMSQPEMAAMLLGIGSLAIVFFWPARLGQWIPSPLIALIAGTVIAVMLLDASDIPRIGEIPSALPTLHWPVFESRLIKSMFGSALLLAGLGAIDSLLTSLVADNMTKKHHDSDRELIGQGIGNMFAGLFGALPGAGATMRTVVNINAGGRGRLSGVVHALVLLAILLGAAPLAGHIPHAVLAGILIKVGIDIIDWGFIRRAHRAPLFSSMLMLGVMMMTVFVDLITAVFIGVFIANLVTIDRLTHLQLDKLTLTTNGAGAGLDSQEQTLIDTARGRILLAILEGPMSFGVARGLHRRMSEYNQHETLIIDLGGASLVGITSSIAVEDLVKRELASGRRVFLVGLSRNVRRSFARLLILDLVPPEQRFRTRLNAIRAAS